MRASKLRKHIEPCFWTEDDVKVLRKLLKWGWPTRSLAQALGVSVSAAKAKMHRLDIRRTDVPLRRRR